MFWLIAAQVLLTLFIAVYFAIVTNQQNHELARQSIQASDSTQQIVAQVRQSGACTTTKLLRFIIYASARRSERLGASHGLSDATQRRVRGYLHDACAEQKK